MAGHSKWANIRHRKERSDAKKGKLFSRCAKEIISAVKEGGADETANPRLRAALQRARAANVPNEVIERNIKKAASADQADYSEITYELYGFGGVGIFLEIMTDNRNRIAGEIRTVTNKKGGTIANPGSVAFNFDRKGVIQVEKEHAVEEELFAAVTEAGAEDFEVLEDRYVITTDPADLDRVKEAIANLGFPSDSATLEMVPKATIAVDSEAQIANLELIEALEQLDDVDAVYHTMDLVD